MIDLIGRAFLLLIISVLVAAIFVLFAFPDPLRVGLSMLNLFKEHMVAVICTLAIYTGITAVIRVPHIRLR